MPRSKVGPLHAWLAATLLSAPFAAAQTGLLQQPANDVTFVTRHWHSGNGLPQNTVNALLLARDGHLWLATLGGLCRFDGEHIRVFDPRSSPGLRTTRINCLHEARDGTIWIGSEDGVLTSYHAGRFTPHPEVRVVGIHTIAEDDQGRLLVGTTGQLWRRDGEVFQAIADDRLVKTQVLHRRRSGALLAATEQALWQLDADGPRQLAIGHANCLAELGDRLLVGTAKGLHCLTAGGLAPWQPAAGLDQAVQSLLVAHDGALWVGTFLRCQRIARSQLPDRDRIEPDDKALQPLTTARETQAARALCEDREGGVWVGNTERGAMRYRPADVLTHGFAQGLPQRGLDSVVGDGDGGLLVATITGLYRRAGERFERFPQTAAFGTFRTAFVDPDGTQWFSADPGLLRRDAAGFQVWCPKSAWPCDQLRAIVRDGNGDHWLGGKEGLALLRDRAITVPPIAASFHGRNVRTLALAPDGALWVGEADRLVRIAPDRATLREWRSGEQLPFGEIRSVLPEAGESAWIATYGGGVVRVDGDRIVAIDERHGICDQHLCAMIAHGDHFVLASNRGICLVRRQQVEAVATGAASSLACRVLGTPGGGPIEINGGFQNCANTIAGKLWFCGIEQLLEFDPARLQTQPRDRPTNLENVFLGENRHIDLTAVDAPPGVRTLLLRLGTCAFEHYEQTRFRWRLVGLTPDWTAPSYERDVRLLDLPAGDFVFEATTVDCDGTPAGNGLRLPIHVPQLWWESTPWRVLGAIAAAAMAGLLIRFGAKQTASRAARLQRLVDERTGELVAVQQQLEQRVAERTADLSEALRNQAEELRERQRLERQLQQMQRMEGIGQLAGGIAHDFNNLLTVVSGAGELLAMENTPQERTELCRSIKLASERGRNLTQHLLAVASRQHVTTAQLDLTEVVTGLLPVLRSLVGDDITLRFDPPAQNAPVRAAVTQVEQILLNLAANARDAMPRGGALTIRITSAAERVELVVADEGQGMPPEVLEHAFEPFFSTKGHGVGRGLGLATVYGITKQLDGTVRIDSAVGKGTTIHIVLPRDASVGPERQMELPRATPLHLHSRVLLVEDEAAVRGMLERLLRNLGCSVQAAVDGADAVAVLRAAPQAFDVVVSDVVMPGLQGRQLVEALRAVRADMPIVFVSGYLDGRLTHRDLTEMGLEILAKPVESAKLAAVLQRLDPRGTTRRQDESRATAADPA